MGEIFSFHLVKRPFFDVVRYLRSPLHHKNIPGLNHSESFITMNLGKPVLAPSRYNFKTLAMLGWWQNETALDEFLGQTPYRFFSDGWQIRMKLYRRWGVIRELKNSVIDPAIAAPDKPTVGLTLARLNLLHTSRFATFGKPVERQVRDDQGHTLALAAFRPFNTFCTFSIWKNEAAMVNMVAQASHNSAMQERVRKDFHHEFTTMRLVPFKELGARSELA